MNTHHGRTTAWLQTALSGLTTALALLTIFWRDWIEALTGWDPDRHNGAFEVTIIAVLALTSVVAGVLARRMWRQMAW